MKRFYALLGLCLIVMFTAKAQVVTTDPAFPTDGAAVTIVFDATQGTAGLKGFTGDVRIRELLLIRVKMVLIGGMLRIGT